MADNDKAAGAAPSLSSSIRSHQAYIYDLLMSDKLLSEEDLTNLHALLDTQMCIVTLDDDCFQLDKMSQVIKDGHCPCTRDMDDLDPDTDDTDQHIFGFNFTHVAAALDKHLFLKQLLDHGCALETRVIPKNWTPLMFAVHAKSTECIKLILKYSENNLPISSAICTGKDDDQETKQPECSCENESKNSFVIQNLSPSKDNHSQDYTGMVEDCLEMIFFAAKLDPSTLTWLFKSGKCFIPKNIPSITIYKLLILTLREKPVNFPILLEAGADPNAANDMGMTPLIHVVNHYYFFENFSDIIKLLLEAGATVNIHDDNGDTPLLAAILQGSGEIVDMLLEFGADPNYSSADGYPALTLATLQEPSMVRKLIQHGARINHTSTDHRYSAIHMAAWEGQLEAVNILLESSAPVDEQTNDKNTPLSLAAHGNYEGTVKRFLELGVCNVNNADKDLDTPLLYATFNDNEEMVDMLLAHGADPHMPSLLMVTPLWNAVYADNLQIVRRLLLCNVEQEVFSVGIDQHADDNGSQIYQLPRSPLWIAVMHGNTEIVQLLLLAAYDLQKETWIRTDALLDRCAETDRNFEDPDVISEDVLPVVYHHCCRPLSLVNICSRFFRARFRKNLKHVTEHLPIPATLSAHLNLEFI